MTDIRKLLLTLGERLVQRGFKPAFSQEETRSTATLVQFLLWLDKTPEAREELANMGFDFVQYKGIEWS